MPSFCHWKRIAHLGLIPLVLAVLGCPKAPPPVPPIVIQPDKTATAGLEAENRRLHKTVDDQQQALEALEAELGRLQVQLIERDARSQVLAEELASRQEMLDEAVVEVVRTKAKLRSIESRAEAASSITEVEIALKGLKDRLAATPGAVGEEVRKAETLLRMSTTEFKKENYGGALYLAGQAQSQIHTLQNQLAHQDTAALKPGEVLFAQPVPLKVLKRSNLRAEPSLRARIRRTLEAGAPLVGHAYIKKWIRVETEEGIRGWIFQSLVGSPSQAVDKRRLRP